MPDVFLKDVWVSIHKSFKLKVSGNISHDVTFSCKMIFSHQLLRSKLIKPISQPAFLARVSLNGGGGRGLPSLLANLVGPSHGEPLKWNFVSHFLSRWLSKLLLRGRNWFQSYGSIFLAKLFWKLHQYTQLLDQESIMRRHWKGLLSASVFLQDVFGSDLQNSKTFFTWE